MKLKKCPFCGGEAKVTIFLGRKCVACTNCLGAIMPAVGMTKEEAIEAWNRREPMDKIVEQLEEYEGAWSGRNRRDEYKDCDYEGGCAGCVNCKTEDAYRTAIEIVKSGGKNE